MHSDASSGINKIRRLHELSHEKTAQHVTPGRFGL